MTIMVFWSRQQIDEDGLRVKETVERVMNEMGKPAGDFVSIIQTGDSADPHVTIRTARGVRSFTVSLSLFAQADDVAVSTKIRHMLERAYRAD